MRETKSCWHIQIHATLPPCQNLPVSAKSKDGLACAIAEIAELQQRW
jgi:hypothetical protein